MARVPDIEVKLTLDPAPLKAALYELLQAVRQDGVADALYAADGVLTIPRALADTRDGREQIIADVQEAFEYKKVGVIIIKDGPSLAEAISKLHQNGYSTQGFA